jgi:hypothetical protein
MKALADWVSNLKAAHASSQEALGEILAAIDRL